MVVISDRLRSGFPFGVVADTTTGGGIQIGKVWGSWDDEMMGLNPPLGKEETGVREVW